MITSSKWSTERGLRVGDSLDRVRELYPELRRFTDLYGDAPVYRYEWALVLESSQVGGPPNLIDRLSAEIRGRKVEVVHGLAVRRRRLSSTRLSLKVGARPSVVSACEVVACAPTPRG